MGMTQAILLTLTSLVLGLGLMQGQTAKKPVAVVAKDGSGVAIRGYDPVAYFEMGKAMVGKPEHEAEYRGAKFRFVSASHKQSFEANPEKFAPQYGGYCAWAVGHNYTAPVDPEAWKIVDGKLYLNYNKDVQRMWSSKQAKWITEGDKNWPGLHQ